MISFNWVITIPKHLDEKSFDSWYLGKHTEYAKVALNMVRYSINRRVKKQPAVAHGNFFRIAQEYWGSWDDMVACWNHHTGYTLLGDGLAYMGLDPGTLPGIALTEETQFDVAQPAVFSTIRRGYRARPDGTITKLIAFGMANNKATIKNWYARKYGKLGMDPLVREHTFGIGVGKVQVSSAIRVPWDEIAPADRPAALAQLAAFAEDRYLHQTVSRDASGQTVFHEDLPIALRSVQDARQLTGEWRIHFHVPIYLERFGLLSASRQDILDCLKATRSYSDVQHFEVETYAWGVLPPELREADLAAGIAREIEWFREAARA